MFDLVFFLPLRLHSLGYFLVVLTFTCRFYVLWIGSTVCFITKRVSFHLFIIANRGGSCPTSGGSITSSGKSSIELAWKQALVCLRPSKKQATLKHSPQPAVRLSSTVLVLQAAIEIQYHPPAMPDPTVMPVPDGITTVAAGKYGAKINHHHSVKAQPA